MVFGSGGGGAAAVVGPLSELSITRRLATVGEVDARGTPTLDGAFYLRGTADETTGALIADAINRPAPS